LWGALAPALVVAIGACLLAAAAARSTATARAETDAVVAAQRGLTPLLLAWEPLGPITGERANELAADIEETVLAGGPVSSVRIYAPSGRILYDADPSVVAVRPSYVRGYLSEVVDTGPASQVRSGTLQTYVPLQLGASVVVAEMSQPYGPIASRAWSPWYVLAIALGVALAATTALWVRSRRAPTTPPVIGVIQTHPAFRAAEDARLRAEQRATATEVAFKDLQTQFRTTLDELKAMEAKVSMYESQTTGTDDEIAALREELRATMERLQEMEADNATLRERLAERQAELDESRAELARSKERTPSVELEELRRRVEIAERRATEMETEVERIEAELDYTANRFHMAKLTEALREFDNDGGDEDDMLEHPKVIFSTGPRVSRETAR
jgi:hypothetical protein